MLALASAGAAESQPPRVISCTATMGAGFYPVTPCRVIDTRDAGSGGPLMGFEERQITIAGNCGIPLDASAVSFNFTVLGAGTDGSMTAFEPGAINPGTSIISYRMTDARANNGVLKITNGSLIFFNVTHFSASAHLIVDVNGYFKE